MIIQNFHRLLKAYHMSYLRMVILKLEPHESTFLMTCPKRSCLVLSSDIYYYKLKLLINPLKYYNEKQKHQNSWHLLFLQICCLLKRSHSLAYM